MPLYHNKWRSFLNESTNVVLTEEELLAEGRLDDVKAKYEELDKRGLVDELSKSDPSGSNAYLGWMAKQLAAFYAEEEQYSARQDFAERVKDSAKQFHLNKQRLKKKDLYQYKTVKELYDAIGTLGDTRSQKRKREKEDIVEGSSEVFENEDFFAVRPLSTEASCHYGRNSKWCISARGNNYYNQYTSEGKGFVMVRLNHMDEDDVGREYTIVYERDGEVDEVFDIEDTSGDVDDFRQSAMANVINGALIGTKFEGLGNGIKNQLETYGQEDSGIRPMKSPKIMKKIAYEIYNKYNELAPHMEEPPEELDDLPDWILENAKIPAYHIILEGEGSIESDPPGPDPAEFQAIQDAFDQNAKHAYVSFDEYDEGKYGYDGGMTWEFDEINENDWVGEPDFSYNGDEFDTVTDIARQAMDDNYIYPDDIELEWGGVWDREKGAFGANSALSIRINIRQEYDEDGTPDGFETFANRVQEYDGNYDAVKDEIIKKLYSNHMIKSEVHDNAANITANLEKDLKNFDQVDLDEGEILAYGTIRIQAPRVPNEFIEISKKIGTNQNTGEWFDIRADLFGHGFGSADTIIQNLETQALKHLSDQSLTDRFKKSIGSIFKKAASNASKQMNLDLRENSFQEGNFSYGINLSGRIYHPNSGKMNVPFYVKIPLEDDSMKANLAFLKDIDKFWSLIEDSYEEIMISSLNDLWKIKLSVLEKYMIKWKEEKEGAPNSTEGEGTKMNEHFRGWRTFLNGNS